MKSSCVNFPPNARSIFLLVALRIIYTLATDDERDGHLLES